MDSGRRGKGSDTNTEITSSTYFVNANSCASSKDVGNNQHKLSDTKEKKSYTHLRKSCDGKHTLVCRTTNNEVTDLKLFYSLVQRRTKKLQEAAPCDKLNDCLKSGTETASVQQLVSKMAVYVCVFILIKHFAAC